MRKILVPECVVHDTLFATTPRRRLALAVNECGRELKVLSREWCSRAGGPSWTSR